MKKALSIFLFCGILASSFLAASFALAAKPKTPELWLPVSGATDVSVTPRFAWRTVDNADWYDLLITATFSKSNITKNNYQLQDSEALARGTSYSWHVRACNDDGCSGYAQGWTFTTAGTAGMPDLISPKAGATNVSLTPTFDWSDTGAAWYHLYVGKSGSYNAYSSITSSSYRLKSGDALSQGTTYSWFVAACDSSADCVDSRKSQFKTKGTAGSETSESGTPGERAGFSGGFVCPGQMDSCPAGAVCIANPLCADNVTQLIDAITGFIFWVGLAIAPVLLIIAGFLFVTSAGSPEKVQTAKRMILYTLIGLAVVLLAKGLIAVLKSIIGVT